MSKRNRDAETSQPTINKKNARRSQRATPKLVSTAAGSRSAAPFALASDGTLLINVDVLDPLDLGRVAGRTLFVGTSLEEGEKQLARTVLDAAGHELRARIVGALPAQHTSMQKPESKDQGGEP